MTILHQETTRRHGSEDNIGHKNNNWATSWEDLSLGVCDSNQPPQLYEVARSWNCGKAPRDIIMPQTSMKLTVHIGFRLCVRASVRPWVRVSIHSSRTMHARVLKFHIWIPHGKYFTLFFFPCPSYLPFWSYARLNKIQMKSDACHILWTVHARVLKFHIWIAQGKIADTYFVSCPSYLPFWSYAPLKQSELKLVGKISRKVFELGAWNLISW